MSTSNPDRFRLLVAAVVVVQLADIGLTGVFWRLEQNPILLTLGWWWSLVLKTGLVGCVVWVAGVFRAYRVTWWWLGVVGVLHGLVVVTNISVIL